MDVYRLPCTRYTVYHKHSRRSNGMPAFLFLMPPSEARTYKTTYTLTHSTQHECEHAREERGEGKHWCIW